MTRYGSIRRNAVFLSQILPFADGPAVRAYGEFEKAIYGTLQAA